MDTLPKELMREIILLAKDPKDYVNLLLSSCVFRKCLTEQDLKSQSKRWIVRKEVYSKGRHDTNYYYFPNGKMSKRICRIGNSTFEQKYDRNGKYHGSYKAKEDGKTNYKGYYSHGVPVGVWASFRSDGGMEEEYYVDGFSGKKELFTKTQRPLVK
jgi:antitoxin component YwqK of YwqJK toxin-antitoxin module